MSEFTPNWKSKTTRNRLNKIESFAEDFFDYKVTRRCHSGKLNIHFGQSTPGHDLSVYMKDLLLVAVGNYYVGDKSYEYYFSWNNLLWAFIQSGLVTEEYAKEITGLSSIKRRTYKNSLSICLSVFQSDEKQAKMFFDLRFFEVYNQHLLTENAEYTEDAFTGRMKADFQNKSKVIKARYFSKWWDADAEACSYTLIHQHYINTVLPWWGTHNVLELKVMPLMYKEKNLIRNHFSKELGVSVEIVKEVLAAIMFDCKLVNNPFSGVYKILKENHHPDIPDFFKRAESSVLLQGLIRELRNIWPKLMIYWNRQRPEGAARGRKIFRTRDIIDYKTGEILKKGRFRPSSFRAAIYFELEKKMLSAIRLNFNQPVIHLMHDGFFCKHKPDIQEIKDRVLAETGFDVNFSLKQYD